MGPEQDSDPDRGCPKCGHDEAGVNEIAVSSRGMFAYLDVEDRNLQMIYCTDCGYTEHYQSHSQQDKERLADLFFERS
jgi:predicted nucleic-acid-binding Zn-ribbon protein